MNLKEDIKFLWDNKTLIRTTRYNLIFVVIMLLINVSLISVPNYYGVLNGIRSIDNLEGIFEPFEMLYEAQVPCEIDASFTFVCQTDISGQYGNYQVVYQDIIDTTGITSSTIFFGSKNMMIIYIDENDIAYELAGDYRLLEAFDFSNIKTQTHAFDTLDQHYENVTDIFLSNIYFSSIGERMLLIFSSQFAQIAIYVVVISVMFMILNYKSKIPKISYAAAVKITIMAMTGPAIASAIIGVFANIWGSILFPLIYAIRMMFVYYVVHKETESID
jgi:hypothetical protein